MCKYKFSTYILPTPLKTSSIHGIEKNTECVYLNITLTYKGKSITLSQRQLIIIKDCPSYDIIIGLNDIRKYNLTHHLREYFTAQEDLVQTTQLVNALSSGGSSVRVATDLATRPKPVPTQTGGTLAPGRVDNVINVYPKDLFLDPGDNVDHIDELTDDHPWSRYFNEAVNDNMSTPSASDTTNGSNDPWEFHVEGTEPDKAALLRLLDAHRDVFATSVKATPAIVTPFAFDVNKEGWYAERANKARARLFSPDREAAIEKFLTQALKDKVIAPSDSPAWSQVLLTKKPNGKWRFCLDYRTLNKYTLTKGWPIPSIQDVLAKIGSYRPKFFAVMDCTAGYHQMPIEEQCQNYTTFTTKFGNYKWLRTPMGPHNAPSLYQKAMSTEIFPDLIHQILEVYLDDIITWADFIEGLSKNLQLIFRRLRKHNVTLNPEKCRFGMSEVEYVGHLINEIGINFSDDKKTLVANWEQPMNKGSLKSFIGLAGYFRRHIRGYAELVHPLNELCEGYDKKKKGTKLEWDEVSTKAFTDTQSAIVNCQTLYFQDQSAPLRVYTDASDYGIGAYLCQVIDEVEQPIAFISKTLSKAEKRWSVYEKETFAIFYSLRKWEHYLQGTKFTLFTDHKNLTYLNKDPSPKVMRWKVAVQEYNFEVAYIEGHKNVIADGFSRLCPKDLDAELEPPNRTIAMFLESYPLEEKAIDTALFLMQGIVEREFPVIYIHPEYEWEAKRRLADRDAEIIRRQGHTINPYTPNSRRSRRCLDGNIVSVHALLSVKNMAYHQIPSQFYDIISKCHNSTVGHWSGGDDCANQRILEGKCRSI